MNDRIDKLTSHTHSSPRDIVLYDGQCAFCTQSIGLLNRFDGRGRLEYVSIHDPRVREQFPDLTMEMLMEQMYVVPQAAPHQRYSGAAALRYLSRRLPRLWFAAPFLHFPFSLPFWQLLYRQIAKRRYRIAVQNKSCEAGTCELHLGDRK